MRFFLQLPSWYFRWLTSDAFMHFFVDVVSEIFQVYLNQSLLSVPQGVIALPATLSELRRRELFLVFPHWRTHPSPASLM